MGNEQPWTIARLLEWTREYFAKRGVEKPRLDAEVLLAHALGVDRVSLYTGFDRVVDEKALAQFREHVKRRAEGCPVAYITGRKEFMSLAFEVSPDVLIPRPATEILVEKAIEVAAAMASPTIADIGTGSGGIAVSAAVNVPHARVFATDVSEAALKIAERNAHVNGVQARVRFLLGHMLEPLRGEGLAGKIDLLLSNPPYVAESEWPNLMKDVREYEPRGALVSEGEPLRFYRALAGGAEEMLSPGGYLMVEVGAERAEAVAAIFADAGLCSVETIRDYERIERVVLGRRKAGD
jgi:release factor glutamine methyltransferase